GRRPEEEAGTAAGRGGRHPVPHAAAVPPRAPPGARRHLRLLDLLRVRGRRRPDLPRGVRGVARPQAQPRMGVRARRSLLARAPRRDVARAVRVSATVLTVTCSLERSRVAPASMAGAALSGEGT